ncbi:MAG: methyltransferase domain-containing protein [Myxococcales bacterium]|nr:methyltransferase domain-containing protein [Myxococcales bacterium]
MRDVIPTALGRDTEYLFARMTARTLALAGAAPARRVLDVASGLAQDARALAGRGALAVAAEPSARMTALARQLGRAHEDRGACLLRAWGDALPFADASFDAVICKGAIDHFEAPARAIAEMARVTKRGGRVVLAIANFESLSCRAARRLDGVREGRFGRALPRGRRHYDVPHDHFTRYDLELMCAQASASLELTRIEGISLGWGMPAWSRVLERVPRTAARATLAALDATARRLPSLADVVLLVGQPRASASTSAYTLAVRAAICGQP